METAKHKTQLNGITIPGVKNIIAVASGKGGVGKSTVSVNLALALQELGATAGILDADIYGPSQPLMLGSFEYPDSKDQKSLEPVVRYGLQSMSIGYLVEQTSAMIWRGPIVSKALQQILKDTRWHDVDYLIVDLPPGTGDVQLTMSQKIPVTAGLIVTTPQDLALCDARRAAEMFKKVNIPTVGIIENMSTFTCPHCDKPTALFGEGGGEKMAADLNTTVLAQLPLSLDIRKATDNGKPIVAEDPTCTDSKAFIQLAQKVIDQVSSMPKDYGSKFGAIKVESS